MNNQGLVHNVRRRAAPLANLYAAHSPQKAVMPICIIADALTTARSSSCRLRLMAHMKAG